MKTLLISLLLLTGCNAMNCEYKKWNSNGQLVEQVRTGKVNVAYWFGLDSGGVEYKDFKAGVSGMIERPDPNTASAIAEGVVKGLGVVK